MEKLSVKEMKFVDLKREYEFFKDEIESRWDKIRSKGIYFFSEQTEELEGKFPKIIGKKYCVTVKNGTDALFLVLKKVYKKGMAIVLPNFTAYPTAVACRNITDNLIYVDVDESLTIDMSKVPDVKGILVTVNLFGNNCKEYKGDLILIEDCAQSTGSGTQGDYSIFSFYPTKPLASMGDGGAICFNKKTDYFENARFYGQEKQFGINSRIDEFQAAVVNSKLYWFQTFNTVRINTAQEYKKAIKGIKVNSRCVYHQFPVLFKDREKIIKKLEKEKIPYMIHYKHHVNEIDYLKGKNPSRVGYRVNDKIISFPIHVFLEDSEVNKIRNFLHENRSEEI